MELEKSVKKNREKGELPDLKDLLPKFALNPGPKALLFDENGDLKETADKCANAQKRVLTDLQARTLARTAINIRRVFGKKEQDIEWGIMNGRVYIVQARPYNDKK